MSQLTDLKERLHELKSHGRKFIKIDQIIDYCEIQSEDFDANQQAENNRTQYEHKMTVWKEDILHNRELSRSINESAYNTLRTIILVSGGSAAAVLAFLGSIWKDASDEVRSSLAEGLFYFGGSLILAAIAYGMIYMTLVSYGEKEWDIAGITFRISTILLAITCFIFLVIGLSHCHQAITK